ncbi:hypothetical protein DL771_000686 [Monosporascus sp. 5C6A]|nr:hypothetical protein DL771_000686 [Monosporascus sp. 5C6A]
MAPDSDQDDQGGFDEDIEFDLARFDDGTDGDTKWNEENNQQRFEAAGKNIRRRKRFTNEDAVDEFLHEYRDIAGKASLKDGSNLFHVLVETVKHTDDIEPEHVELLVRRLVKDYPDLLKYPNKDGHNPVFMAIRATKPQLVEYMISACAKDKGKPIFAECLNDALSRKAPGGGHTCLHAAFKERLNPGTTRMLIESASDEALAVQDDLGKTPLHYAVSFGQCTDVRADLIDLFIQRDFKAIESKSRPQKTFLDLSDKGGSSIYQEHQNTRITVTRTIAEKQRKANESNNQNQINVVTSSDKPASREPKSQTGTRDSRHAVSAKPAGDRDAERYGGVVDARKGLDEREELRQKKKAEEAKERATAGRDASQNRSTKIHELDNKAAQLTVPAANGARQQEPAPNTPIKRSNTARLNSRPDQKEEPPVRPVPAPRKSTPNLAVALATCTKNSDKILLSLKLHYMRTRNAEMVISFLYGTNMDDIQISFDYDRLPRNMLWDVFVKQFGADTKSGLKFDRVLQYATFPRVEVRPKDRVVERERQAEIKSGIRQLGPLGRKDMKYFFDWLYEKGVRHIIKLSVEDTGDLGEKVHSDQAIQESLERFIVEHLDWRKADLDPETILHVSSRVIEKEAPTLEDPKNTELVPDRQLKQLCLRWSGSNAVLRAWSEPDGLPMLPKLRRIYLFQPPSNKTYDNLQWINKKVNEFRTRLNVSRKMVQAREIPASGNQGVPGDGVIFDDVEVIATDSGTDESKVAFRDSSRSTASAPVQGINSHRWLIAAERFASEMIPFWQNTVKDFLESRQNRGTPERVEDDVVLALIDDGVDTFDMFDKTLSNQVLEGKSFDFHDGKVRPPFSSAKGHGTVMANMILRICPMAKIYPIRLKTYDNADGNSSIDVNYAAKAVQAALDKKATIISMSWTLPMKDDKSGSKDRLHTVLQKAVDSKVLMFCSAPDKGKFTAFDYPSGPWRDSFFRIGAAHADGTVFNWTPEDGIAYVLPGVDVIKDQGGSSSFEPPLAREARTRVGDVKYQTGSSVSTALAAGLAAMIIYSIKASIMAVKTANQNKGTIVGIAIPDNGANLIADPDAMRRAFANLGTVTPNKFIQVWEELDKVTEMLEASRSPETKLKRTERFVKFGLKLSNSVKQE